MSDKLYEWKLESNHRVVRQGVLYALNKKTVQAYLKKSWTDDEKELCEYNTLTIRPLKG